MKTKILTNTIAALLLALPAVHADNQKAEEKKDATKQGKTSSSSSVITSDDGTATVTIDINGKKETRTFKLGDGNSTFSFGKDGDGAMAEGAGGFGGNIQAMPEHAKRGKGPWIGIAMESVQEVVRAQLSLAPGEGVVINHVAPESPAAKTGLQANDILLRFEDQILVEPSQLQKLIAMKKPGDSVKLGYLRKGERKEATVTLVEHEVESHEKNPMQWLKNAPLPVAPLVVPPMPSAVSRSLMPKNAPVGFAIAGAGKNNRMEHFQEQLKQLKEKHPGVIVDKRQWLSETPDEMLKGQIEKLKQGLKNSDFPKEEIENILKNLKHGRSAVEEASKAINGGPKQREKEKGEQPKKPGEPL